MTIFDAREKAIEARFGMDQELVFKINVRRDRLFGLWIAEQLGLGGDAAVDYGRALVLDEIMGKGVAGILGHVEKDLAARGIAFTEHDLHNKLDELKCKAREQLIAELRNS